MMKFLPFENIIYKSNFSKAELLHSLETHIKKGEPFSSATSEENYLMPYIGKISNNGFGITRVISYRNSFLPYIQGTILEDSEGTTVKVTMRPHGFVLGFMAVWLGGVSLGCVVTAYAMFRSSFDCKLLIPFGMLLLGILLFVGAFKRESNISKTDLKKILNANVE